jgi:hypothetical protein
MSETATESLDGVLPPTTHEKASAYEGASDDSVESNAPDTSAPSSTLPEGTAINATATSPDSSATSGPPTSPDSSEPAPADSSEPAPADSSEPVTAPDSSAPSNPAPTHKAAQRWTPPLPRIRLQNSLRLRMKVWTDPSTLKRYLMPTGFMRDLVNGQPVSDAMYAYAMSDDDTRLIELTATEWNSLPFFYFQEDGYAPRAAARPMDSLP